ncbi:MAG: hypothetical protein CL431_05390 [Acidimicrobiaceae bacterium]|jgi:hypothetical protein|nr:hypothetical protein [Acidimicrobiaceae bacterium]|tara:strand:- start:37560 stop:38093 length:534 start_codon:yes stop_codon:yes gene_type:complete
MVRSQDKELDVALELFNNELEKLKLKEKELADIKKAERKKADAVKALQEAEKNPDLSAEEKEQAKAVWLKADDDLKRILAGEDPLPDEVPAESTDSEVKETANGTEEEVKGEESDSSESAEIENLEKDPEDKTEEEVKETSDGTEEEVKGEESDSSESAESKNLEKEPEDKTEEEVD